MAAKGQKAAPTTDSFQLTKQTTKPIIWFHQITPEFLVFTRWPAWVPCMSCAFAAFHLFRSVPYHFHRYKTMCSDRALQLTFEQGEDNEFWRRRRIQSKTISHNKTHILHGAGIFTYKTGWSLGPMTMLVNIPAPLFAYRKLHLGWLFKKNHWHWSGARNPYHFFETRPKFQIWKEF